MANFSNRNLTPEAQLLSSDVTQTAHPYHTCGCDLNTQVVIGCAAAKAPIWPSSVTRLLGQPMTSSFSVPACPFMWTYAFYSDSLFDTVGILSSRL